MKNFYAFVDYKDHSSAVEAIAKVNGTNLFGNDKITVQ
jgi:hypothetical protein|tara:strand:- start:1347 stop:1460 length:114 start_codon:yes stop_codon:yes gene_type:complete